MFIESSYGQPQERALGKKLFFIALLVVSLIFWRVIDGHMWISLMVVPTPPAPLHDAILGPPDNSGWRRSLGLPLTAVAARDFYLTALPQQGWTVLSDTYRSEANEVYCIQGQHPLLPPIYLNFHNKKRGRELLNESLVKIYTAPDRTICN